MSRKRLKTAAPGTEIATVFSDSDAHQDQLYSYLGLADSASVFACNPFWRDSYRAAEAKRPPGELLLDCLALLRNQRGDFKSAASSPSVRKKIFQAFEQWRQACGFTIDGWRETFSFDDMYFLFYRVSNGCGVERAGLISAKELPEYERQLQKYCGTMAQLSLWAKARKFAYVCQLVADYFSRRSIFSAPASIPGIEDLAHFVPDWRDVGAFDLASKAYGCQLLASILTCLRIDSGLPQARSYLERFRTMSGCDAQVLGELLSSPKFFECILSKASLIDVFGLKLRRVQMIRQNPAIQEWSLASWQAMPLEVFDAKMPLTGEPLVQSQVQQLIRNQAALLGLVKRRLPAGGEGHKLALGSLFGIDPRDPDLPLLHSYHAYTTALSSNYQFGSGVLCVYLLATWGDPKALLQVPESVLNDRKRWVKVTSNERKALYQVLQECPNDWRLLCDRERFDALVAERYATLPPEEDESLLPQKKPVADLPVVRFDAGLKPPTRTQEDELSDLRFGIRF
ncbi:MAG: hypothetical protein P1U34_07420 [Coxiellaceae bacterium]|nr:hypothetical protein [Coxiellaceae bacterium]